MFMNIEYNHITYMYIYIFILQFESKNFSGLKFITNTQRAWRESEKCSDKKGNFLVFTRV